MEFVTKDLIKALTTASSIIDKKTFNYFIFEKKKIVAFSAYGVMVIHFNTGMKAVIPAELLAFLNKVTSEKVTLDIEENECVVKGGKFKSKFTVLDSASVPTYPYIADHSETKKQIKFDQKLVSGLAWCSKFTDPKASESTYTCVKVKNDYMAALDDFQIAEFKLGEEFSCDALVPAEPLKCLDSMSKVVKVSFINSNWMAIIDEDNTHLYILTVQGDFPKLKKITNIKDGVEITFPHSLKELLDRVSIFLDNDQNQNTVTITIKNGKKANIYRKAAFGEFSENFTVEASDSEEISFAMNPIHLATALELSEKPVATYTEGKIQFASDEGQQTLTLITE